MREMPCEINFKTSGPAVKQRLFQQFRLYALSSNAALQDRGVTQTQLIALLDNMFDIIAMDPEMREESQHYLGNLLQRAGLNRNGVSMYSFIQIFRDIQESGGRDAYIAQLSAPPAPTL